MKAEYVVGFLTDGSGVALVTKQRPDWQKNRLNGVGGKIEAGEGQLQAMVREWQEETGTTVGAEAWRQFAVLHWADALVYFFVAKIEDRRKFPPFRLDTDEPVLWYSNIHDLSELPVLPNLRWLIPLALDRDSVVATIHDSSAPK